MCKFGYRDNNYRTVLSELKRLCNEAIELRETENLRETIGRQRM